MADRRRAILALVLLAATVSAPLGAQGTPTTALTFTPPEWRVGEVPDEPPRTLEVRVSNGGTESASVSFIPTCDCLSVVPSSQILVAGATATFRLTFDPAGYDGAVELDYLVRTDVPGIEKALFGVFATVEGVAVAAGSAQGGGEPGGEALVLPLYYTAGCRACDRLVSEMSETLERGLGRPVVLDRRNILDPAVYEEYTAALARTGQTERAYPALLVGETMLQGEREIRENTLGLLAGGSEIASGPDADRRGVDLRILPIVAAGLLDGVNPCAFSTLVFLVSSLAVAGRGRREVLVVGGLFAAGVFVTYYAIGLGAFGALRAAAGFPVVALVLRWVLFAALLVLAGLSIYDWSITRRGQPGKMLLQLPTALKLRIHGTIRGGARATALGLSAAAMGAVVSVFELACTGQVYLPAIAYMVRSGAGSSAYLYLLVYNLGFIAPLAAVFILAYLGLTSKKLAEIVRSSVGVVKLGLAGLFILLAVLTAVT